jgi:VWFA-related protein
MTASAMRVLVRVVAAFLGGTTAVAQGPLFRARTEGVRIDTLVTDRGRPIAALQPGDFEVLDNGVPQAIELASLADVAVNVVLTLDVSGSVTGAKLASLTRAAGSLLDALAPDDTAALITFGRAVERHVPLTRQVGQIRQALAQLEAGGDTALVDASLAAMLVGDTDAGRTLVVVFSDGVDTASFVHPDLVVATARRVNGVVYGVSSGEDSRFLHNLSDVTGGRVIEIGTSRDPGSAFLEILQEFRRRYVITFTPTGVASGGWHRLDVRVKRSRARVQARSGYFSAAQ